MFDTLSREMGFGMRMLFANRWLTESVIVKVLEKNEPLLPMMHTTTALTMLQSGVKSNVMPTVATAVVNFRVLPGDTIEAVTEHARTVIDNPAVEVSIRGHTLEATAWGETVDVARHQPAVEVKGATLSSLSVHRDESGAWTAQCIVDV